MAVAVDLHSTKIRNKKSQAGNDTWWGHWKFYLHNTSCKIYRDDFQVKNFFFPSRGEWNLTAASARRGYVNWRCQTPLSRWNVLARFHPYQANSISISKQFSFLSSAHVCQLFYCSKVWKVFFTSKLTAVVSLSRCEARSEEKLPFMSIAERFLFCRCAIKVLLHFHGDGVGWQVAITGQRTACFIHGTHFISIWFCEESDAMEWKTFSEAKQRYVDSSAMEVYK